MKLRKGLSLVLAICMMISLLPQIAAAGEEAENANVKIVYDIYSGFTSSKMEYYTEVSGAIENKTLISEFADYKMSNGFWKRALPLVGSGHRVDYGNWLFFTSPGNWYALSFRVPKAGAYKLVLNSAKTTAGGKFAYMVLPGGTSESAITSELANVSWDTESNTLVDADNKALGVIDCTVAAASPEHEVTFSEAGEYLLVFKNVYNGTNGYLYIDYFTLTNGTGAVSVPMGCTVITDDDKTIAVGDTTTATTSTLYGSADWKKKTYTADQITFESSDTDVAEVSANGTITAKAVGTAEITAIVDGAQLVSETITVEEAISPSEGITVKYDFAEQLPAYGAETRFDTFTYDTSHNLWSYYSNSKNMAYGAPFYYMDWGMSIHGAWITHKVNVPKAGVYTPYQYYGGHKSSSGIVDVYMIPASVLGINPTNAQIEAQLVDTYKIGSLDCTKHNTTSTATVQAAEPSKFAEKELTEGEHYLVYDARNAGYSAYGNLILNGGRNSVAMDAALNIEGRMPLFVGNTTSASVTAYMSDGETEIVPASEVIFASSNASVATVDENGLITATGEGEADISISYNGFTDTKKITVEQPVMSDITVKYDFEEQFPAYGATTGFDTFTYDTSHNLWSYYSNSKNAAFGGAPFYYMDWGMSLHAVWITHKVNVPKAGVYTPYQYYGGHKSSSGIIDVYMIPASELGMNPTNSQIEAQLVDTYKLGSLDCTKHNTTTTNTELAAEPSKFAAKNFAAGEHYLVYDARNAGYSAYGNLILDGGAGSVMTSAELMLEGSPLLFVGKTLGTSVTAFMSDGKTQIIPAAEITFASSDDSVATVDENGLITATGEGEADISISYNGFNNKKKISVEEFVPSDRVVEYDFAELIPSAYDREPFENWSYNATGDTWSYAANSRNQTHGGKTEEDAWQRIRNRDFGMQLINGVWFAVKIQVPEAGVYLPFQQYGIVSEGTGTLEVYMFESQGQNLTNTQIQAELIPENLIGTQDCYDAGTPQIRQADEPVVFELLNLKKTEYYVVYYSGGFASFGNLVLDGVEGLKTIDVSCETDIDVGDEVSIAVSGKLLNRDIIRQEDLTITYTSSDPDVLTVSDGVMYGKREGTAVVTIVASYEGKSCSKLVNVMVTDNSGVESFEIVAPERHLARESKTLSVVAHMNSKNVMDVEDATFSIVSSEPDGMATLTGASLYAALSGTVRVKATGTFKGEPYETERELEIQEGSSKTQRTLYTDEMIRNARENAEKYDWAKDEFEKVIDKADSELEKMDVYYDLFIGEGLPRARQAVGKYNENFDTCRYCGEVTLKGWQFNPTARPWKMQCPMCKRLFPSNDFASFLRLGITEKGGFNRAQALDAHREMLIGKGIKLPDGEISDERKQEIADGAIMTRAEQDYYGYGVKGGYLYNDLYPEVDEVATVNCGKGFYEGERVETWGVDDGWGYLTGKVTEDSTGPIIDRHNYAALFNYTVWFNLSSLPYDLGRAYMYTGDAKYGRPAAVLLDKISDFYPDFTTVKFTDTIKVTDNNNTIGKIVGNMDDCVFASSYAEACDMLFPLLYENDEQTIKEIAERAKKRGTENTKTTGMEIWRNWENNLLIQTFVDMKKARIQGNTGRYQAALATAAVALDREPESDQMFEWIFKTGGATGTGEARVNTGGDLYRTLIHFVDRDGHGTESSPYYNSMWVDNFLTVADLSALYGKEEYDLYKHVKFSKMIASLTNLTLADYFTVQIGDSSALAQKEFAGYDETYMKAFVQLKDTALGPQIADYIYKRNGGELDDLHYDIYTKNPEGLGDEVTELLKNSGYTIESKLMGGYGLAILRDGANYSKTGGVNNLRDFWIYFGGARSHKHSDSLNLGIEAFGLNFAPDNGYPADGTTNPEHMQWVNSTLAHNTVVVNGKSSHLFSIGGVGLLYPGTVHHFDNSEKVKLMDVAQPEAYDATSEYRRTVVMVEADDDASYGIDFFRVTGGNEHSFSFHAQSGKDITPLYGLGELIPQVDENGKYIGSLAGMGEDGKGAPYTVMVDDGNGGTVLETRYFIGPGADPTGLATDIWDHNWQFPTGTTWMHSVRRTTPVSNQFSVEFDVVDYRKAVKDSKDLHLKLTMLNDFALDEVAFAKGPAPARKQNKVIPDLEYMIATRKGENLDSLFTTVYEPYKGDDYIESIEVIEPEILEGSLGAGDMVKAVKVIHKGGERTDYIIYSTNEDVTYRLENDDNMTFQGFVGVWTKNANDEIIYSYKHGGDMTVTGKVTDLQREVSFENYIDVKLDREVDPETLAGKYVVVDHNTVDNASYEILSAKELENGDIRLDIGTVTTIRTYVNSDHFEMGYIYNIEKGQKVSVLLSDEQKFVPVFEPVADGTTSAGSTYKTTVSATGNDGASVTITGRDMPRGASFDSNTNTFSWKPDSSQVGENHVSLTATDEFGRESVVHFAVTVYGATTGNKNEATETPSTEGSGASGGGGGGGGGAAPTPDKPEDTTNTDEDVNEETGDNTETGNDAAPDASGETDIIRFTDLANHKWAADAINALADDGIIKGTSKNTFSPASNITRADFALLLVRAFDLKSDNSENFDDVSASDYFAPELAIARNTGIVNGIGDNKYAPRNTITRQDVMVIVYRALNTLNVEFGENIEPQFEDFNAIADYAKEAVSALISAGLVNGKNNLIAPTDYTTRAEVAVLIKRILDHLK